MRYRVIARYYLNGAWTVVIRLDDGSTYHGVNHTAETAEQSARWFAGIDHHE